MKLDRFIVVVCCLSVQIYGMDRIFTSRLKVSDGQAQKEVETIKNIEKTVDSLFESARMRSDSSESIEYLSQLVSDAQKSPKIRSRAIELIGNLDKDSQKLIHERIVVYTGLHSMENSTRKHLKKSKITQDQADEMLNIYRNMNNIGSPKKN